MSEDGAPEPDRVPPAPHPRHTQVLQGQEAAEAEFLTAYTSGRLHHGWLLTGPRGIGKATLAWRIATFLLTQPTDAEPGLFADSLAQPQTLDTDPADQVHDRIAALSEPRLFLLRRSVNEKTGRLRDGIVVDDVRRLGGYFALSAPDGGHRVIIIDAADDMNRSAANALLKVLEEPPAGAILLLVSHQPSRLLPTIRSRCRALRLAPLGPADLTTAVAATGVGHNDPQDALAELAGGSVGIAVRLIAHDGLAAYARLVALLDDAPASNRQDALSLAESFGTRDSDRQEIGAFLIDAVLARLARTGSGHPPPLEAAPGEHTLLHRLAPSAAAGRVWAEVQIELADRITRGRAVNLDPVTLFLDTILKINDTAGRVLAHA